MSDKTKQAASKISPMELLSIAGFAFQTAWMLVSFYWLFCDFPAGVPVQARDFSQLWLFLGVAAGYLALHFLGKSPRYNLFSLPSLAFELLGASLLPMSAISCYNGLHLPLGAVCAINFAAGAGNAMLIVSWLDICSRLKSGRYGRFTGSSFAGASLLFALVALLPDSMQPIFSFVYLICSVGLLVFATDRADGNSERAPLESTEQPWRFTKELEPSFFMFGVVFALTFVYLFNFGQAYVLAGLLSVLPGALIIAFMSATNREAGITVIQRALTFITVASCIAVPFLEPALQLACSCVVVAAWAAFTCASNAFIVKKAVIAKDSPFFRQAPARLLVPAAGFAAGWLLATVLTMHFGAHAAAFHTTRLVVAVVLVAVVMLFFPVEYHHKVDGTSQEIPEAGSTIVQVSMSEAELFETRCAAVEKLYQLSPRESDVLRFLAKGRNAAYIQEKLTISPHTVKSHIYNIYRKLDIHSQQKLMDFVESFPLDGTDAR